MFCKEDDLISVIVPIYKVEKYLDKCIQTLIGQTYTNLQIILVDDGSPDNCEKICDEYAKKDRRIEVIHKPNGGLSDARNVGIDIAKGKYIGFVDSDDYIQETMYEDMYNAIKNKNADVCICNFYNVFDGKATIKNEYKDIEEFERLEILKEILLDSKIQSYAWNKLYKTDLFKNIRYPKGKNYEDIGTTFYVLEKCEKIVLIGKPEYFYVNRKESIINNANEKTINDYIQLITKRYDYIEKNIKELSVYNKSYLLKILITANNDISKLKNVSKETKNEYGNLYDKAKEIIEANETNVMKLLSREQINQIKDIMNTKVL